jgi:VWFA-related protein
MRSFAALLALCVALPAQQEQPVFRTTTRLVEFTVVALDKKGNPVTDLKQEDFTVQEKGQRRDVAFFRFEGGTAAADASRKPAALPEGTFSNRVEYSPGPPRNISAIVLDTLNTPPTQTMWARAQVTRSLRALAPQTRVAVYHLGAKLGVIHDFSDDVDSLREKVAKSIMALPLQVTSDIDAMARDAEELLALFDNDPVVAEMLINQIEIEGMANASVRQRRMEMTLRALEALGQHLAGIPGRKNLIWIGGGISMLTITGAMGFGPHGGFNSYEDEVTNAARRLAQQSITLYVVDSRGLTGTKGVDASLKSAPTIPGRGRFDRQIQAEEVSADPLPAAYTLADITGGRVIKNTNDPMDGMSQAARDVQASYSLGFYAGGEPNGKWHKLNVKVKRPGVRLEYRQGFLSEQPAAEPLKWTVEDWRAAVQNPIPSTAIVLDARCEGAGGGQPGIVALTVVVDPKSLYFRRVQGKLTADVEFGIADKAAGGRVGFTSQGGVFVLKDGEDSQQSRGGLIYTRKWKPPEGISTIRIIVRDKLTGRHGTLDLPYNRIPGLRPAVTGRQ